MSEYLLLTVVLLFLNACSLPISEKNADNNKINNQDAVAEPLKINSHAIEPNNSPVDSTNKTITETSTLEDFKGKISVIVFGSTTCPHCRNAVPKFKSDIWDLYKNQTNLWVNVLDGGRFDTEEVSQGLNKNLDFDKITNTECNYVPSWIILDKNGNLITKSCGGEKDLDQMKNDLESALINL